MALWGPWFDAIWLLRPAFSRLRTFLWFVPVVAGLTVRVDLLGVTSCIRALCRGEGSLLSHLELSPVLAGHHGLHPTHLSGRR
jgi:hypothetical protein